MLTLLEKKIILVISLLLFIPSIAIAAVQNSRSNPPALVKLNASAFYL